MNYDPNWTRWIRASLNTWVQANGGPYKLFFEGQPRPTPWPDAWMEFRIANIDVIEYSKGFWRLNLDAQIVSSTPVSKDLYSIDKMVGAASAILMNPIPIYKLGNGLVDDPSVQIGCLTWSSFGDGSNTIIRHYGQIDTTVKLLEATVSVKYYIEFP